MEEGGAEVWREEIATLSLEASLAKRAEFPLACDFSTIWEETYGISLANFKGITTWHFMTAFVLAAEGKHVKSASIREYLFREKKLGSLEGNSFLCELLPLPKQSEIHFPYGCRWANSGAYVQEVAPRRFSMIANAIEASRGAKVIVVYDKKAQALILEKWGRAITRSKELEHGAGMKRPQRFTLHVANISGREVAFLFTPFFGQGQISYEGVSDAVALMRRASVLS